MYKGKGTLYQRKRGTRYSAYKSYNLKNKALETIDQEIESLKHMAVHARLSLAESRALIGLLKKRKRLERLEKLREGRKPSE